MAELGEAYVRIRADLTGLTAGLVTAKAQVASGVAGMGKKITTLGPQIRQVGMAMTGAGAVITGALGLAIKTTGDFQQSMANVQSVAGATSEELTKLTDYARVMGEKSVFSASEAADAMYYLASAGMNTNQIMDSLKGTLDLAAATQSDLAFTSETVAATLSAYSLKAEEAERVSNVFAATVSASQATMEKLSTSMSYVGPVAKSVGMSLEETTGILGNLYNAGLDGSMAGTALRGSISRLLNPSEKAAAILNKLNINVTEFTGASEEQRAKLEALSDAMDELETAGKETSEEYGALNNQFVELVSEMTKSGTKMIDFSEIVDQLHDSGMSTAEAMQVFGLRAGPAMIALTSKGGQAIKDMTDKVTGTQKATEMAAIQINTFEGSMKLLKSAAQELQIALGTTLMPILTDLVGQVTEVVKKVSAWSEKHPVLTETLLKFALVLGPLMLAGGPLLMLAPTIAGITAALPALIAGFAPLLGPAGIILGIATVVALLYTAWTKNWGGIQEKTKAVIDWFKDIPEKFRTFGNDIMANFKKGLSGWKDSIMKIVEGIGNAIIDFVKSIPKKVYQAGMDIITKWTDGIKAGVNKVKEAGGWIAGKMADFLGKSLPKKGPLATVFKGGKSITLEWLKGMLSNLATLEGIGKTLAKRITEYLLGPLDELKDNLGKSEDSWQGFWDSISDGLEAVTDKILESTTNWYDIFMGFFDDMKSGFASTIEEWMKGATTFGQFFQELGQDIVDAFVKQIANMAAEWLAKETMMTIATITGAKTRKAAEEKSLLWRVAKHAWVIAAMIAKEIAYTLKVIAESVARCAQYAIEAAARAAAGLFGFVGGIIGGILGIFGLEKGGKVPGHLIPIATAQAGKKFSRPTLAMVAEGGPERVLNARETRAYERGGRMSNFGPVNVNVIFPNANLENMDQGRLERIFRMKFIPAIKDAVKSGLLSPELVEIRGAR